MNQIRGVFITGTDTDVGKTAVTAGLLTLLRQRGVAAAPMKPVQTGCLPGGQGELLAPDLEFALGMAGMSVAPELKASMAPYRYKPACSPHLAAALVKDTIELARITAAAATLCQHYQFLLIEGAGGVLTPLSDAQNMLDLIGQLGLAAIVVARPSLGTLNHTLLSIAALRAAAVPVAGVVFAETVPLQWGMIEQDNRRSIARLGKVPIIGTLPFMPGLTTGAISATEFARRVAELSWNYQHVIGEC